MKFKVGDKVRVKSWEEIKKTLDGDRFYLNAYFSPSMEKLCGKTIILTRAGNEDYDFSNDFGSGIGTRWNWIEEWLEPIRSDFVVTVRGISPKELKKTFGERIKELEIVRQPRSVAEIYKELLLSAKDCCIKFGYKDRTTLAIVWKPDGTVETGYARRKPSDVSNQKAGQSLALARALGRKDIEEELLAFM